MVRLVTLALPQIHCITEYDTDDFTYCVTLHHLFMLQPDDTFEQFHERYNELVLNNVIAHEEHTKAWKKYGRNPIPFNYPKNSPPILSITQTIVEAGGILLDDRKFVTYHNTDEQNLLT